MSFFGARTKKVTTYGKKRTGVVPLYTDEKLFTPNKADSDTYAAPLRSSGSTPSASPVRPKRAPLSSKISNDNVNLPTAAGRAKTLKKGTKSSLGDAGQKGLLLDDEDAVKKPLVPKKKKEKVIKRERFDCVELSMSRPSARTVVYDKDVVEVTQSLASASLVDIPITPDHSAEYDRLLASVTESREQHFNSFLSSPAVTSLFSPDERAGPAFRKIGEASYSEVFALTTREGREIVVKVIPLFDHRTPASSARNESLPDTSYPGDVLRELDITSRMSEMPGGGFINYFGSYIAKGKYPQILIDQWWIYKQSLGSASVCPDAFGEEQRYALIVLSDGGLDLETFKFDPEHGWKQAAGVFWQTVTILARAEEWTSFEHRDLHEGQILISPSTVMSTSSGKLDYLSPSSTGARATIIDFGLSRLDMPGQTTAVWASFPPEVYEGKGEQWDVYRSMRDTIGSDWSAFHPRTNVLWLRYLVRYLLHRTKTLRRPKLPNATRSRRARAPRKSDLVDEAVVEAYTCLVEAEEKLSSADEVGMGSARDVLAWARASGLLPGTK